MARRDDFDDFFGDDNDGQVIDTRADGRLYRVPLGRLAPNLVNPRQDFGTEDELIDFGKSLARRQNQPCPVVSRTAYLKLWPDHTDRVGDIDYVLVSGERRYRAATTVGMPALDCVVNDGFAADRKTFMEAVVSENVDRQNFDPIEEAYAVQALVAEFGSNRAVAQHFERVDGWVTQRILLTNLDRTMQDLVRQKRMPLEAARTLGKKARDNGWSAQEQADWLEQWQAQQAATAQERKTARLAVRNPPPKPPAPPSPKQLPEPSAKDSETAPSFTAVKQPAPTETAAPPAPVEEPEQTRPPEVIPEPRTHQPSGNGQHHPETERQPPRLLYDDGKFLGDHLPLKMDNEQYFLMLPLLLEKGREKDPAALARVLDQMAVDAG